MLNFRSRECTVSPAGASEVFALHAPYSSGGAREKDEQCFAVVLEGDVRNYNRWLVGWLVGTTCSDGIFLSVLFLFYACESIHWVR